MGINEKMTELADAVRALSDSTNRLTIEDMIKELKAVGAAFISNTATGEIVFLKDSAAKGLRGLNIYGKTTNRGNVGDKGNVVVSVCGKNLFAGAEIGSVNASGAEVTNANDTARRTPYIKCAPGEKYAFSKAVEFTGTSDNGMLRCFDADKNYAKSVTALSYNAKSNIVTIPSGVAYFRFVQFGYGKYENVDLQLEKGDAVTEYEAPMLTQLTVTTPDGLAGIPVSNGGNYIDADGQRWLCDEIDFAKGKYIKRFSESEQMETDLNPADIAAYSVLRTYCPNTTIYNDCDAWMMVKYAADTKMYVDGKFSEVAEAIVNNV